MPASCNRSYAVLAECLTSVCLSAVESGLWPLLQMRLNGGGEVIGECISRKDNAANWFSAGNAMRLTFRYHVLSLPVLLRFEGCLLAEKPLAKVFVRYEHSAFTFASGQSGLLRRVHPAFCTVAAAKVRCCLPRKHPLHPAEPRGLSCAAHPQLPAAQHGRFVDAPSTWT